jgi:hypothetical protein
MENTGPEKGPGIPKFLNKAEEGRLLLGFVLARKGQGFSKEELKKLLIWAEWVSFSYQMLQLALQGKLAVTMSHPDPASFHDIDFKTILSLVGPTAAEEYIKQLKTVDDRFGPQAEGTVSASPDEKKPSE